MHIICVIFVHLYWFLCQILRGGRKHSGTNTFDLCLGKTQEGTVDEYLLSTSYYMETLGLNTQDHLGRWKLANQDTWFEVTPLWDRSLKGVVVKMKARTFILNEKQIRTWILRDGPRITIDYDLLNPHSFFESFMSVQEIQSKPTNTPDVFTWGQELCTY